MYSDSIKERQQELLDVLFKKASGGSGSGIDPTPIQAYANESNRSTGSLSMLRKMTGLDAIKGVAGKVHDGMTPIMAPIMAGVRQSFTTPSGSRPGSDNSETTETPASPTPGGEGTTSPETPVTPEGGGSTPSTPTPTPTPTPSTPSTPAPGESKKENEKGNPEIDPVALAKLLISKALQHKATSLGGLGGAGLGLMLGKSIPGRLLWGLLGGLGGAGLGYAAEKYIK